MSLRNFIRPDQVRELSMLFIVGLAIFFFGSQIDNYYTARTFNRISLSVAVIAVVAVGQTMVVITRNVDLSVGSIVGFTAYFLGQWISDNNDMNPYLAILMAISMGAVMGLLNGVIVAYGNVPAIVVTLGTMAIYRGLLVEYSGAQSVITAFLPDWIKELPRDTAFEAFGLEFRMLVIIAIVVVLIFQVMLLYTAFGRRLYAVGSSPEAAEVAGIPSRRVVTLAFVLSGALSGLAGFMYLARFGNITVVAAQGLELQVVAAAVVGGVNIFGGTGTVFGALMGAVLIGTIEVSLIRMRVSPFWQDALLGVFILVSVASDAVILDRLRNLWARRSLRKPSEDVTTDKELGDVSSAS